VSSALKTFVQYFVIISVTCLLVWFSLSSIPAVEGENKWDYLSRTWQSADKGWLGFMALVAIISHVVRAIRWRMLIAPGGYDVKISTSFYSLMVGYLVNLAVPRGGEVSRCYNLYKLEKVPVEMSFGTVVVERVVDVLCLLILILVSFLIESQKLLAFIDTLPFVSNNSKFYWLLYLGAAFIFLIAISFIVIKRNQKLREFFLRTWKGFREGLLSVFKLKNKGAFIFLSILIWMLYFLMSYTVIKAFPSTSVLGFNAVLSLFAIGSIAMAAPLPGGAGSYHVLVPQGLAFLYQIPLGDAVAFTFIFHGWQTIIMIFWGAISLIMTTYILKRKS
jgi:glycosyltransferase 2 family protein